MYSNILTMCRGLLLVASGLLCMQGTDAIAQTAPGTGGCPPYPAFPDASCTGWQHTGVTLTNYTGSTTITVAGTVIDSKMINGDVTIMANNVTIKRSKIVGGRVNAGYGAQQSGLLLEDVEIDGGKILVACVGDANVTLRRVNIYGCMQGVQAANFTIEDSYIHDLYGAGNAHGEAILGKGNNVTIRHNRLEGVFGTQGTWNGEGGMSAAVALYTHGDFWGPMNNMLMEKNFLKTGYSGRSQAVYCLYGGSDFDNNDEASNFSFIDNVFDRNPATTFCGGGGTVTGVPNSASVYKNCWSNNRYNDNTPITTSLPACPETAKKPQAPINVAAD